MLRQVARVARPGLLPRAVWHGAAQRAAGTATGTSTLGQVRDAERDRLVERERALLQGLLTHMELLDASHEDITRVQASMRDLNDLFLLVVVGEFNSGKSCLINALLGQRFLREGVTPTTDRLGVLKYGDEATEDDSGTGDSVELYFPVPWLRDISLVDTPGTNAVIANHQELTEHFVPRSDLVLFVTSADKPFSASEKAFLTLIQQWGKKVVMILNKSDLLRSQRDLDEVKSFVRHNFRAMLNKDPSVFAVSAALALDAKTMPTPTTPQDAERRQALWQQSGFAELENFILGSLDRGERLRLKLRNPLGVAEYMSNRYTSVVEAHQALLRGDLDTLRMIQEQGAVFASDMERDFLLQKQRVANVLHRMLERGDTFFDEQLRLNNTFALLNASGMRDKFMRAVVADSTREIEDNVQELIDWMLERSYKHWRGVMEFLERRTATTSERVIGHVDTSFDFSRKHMIAQVVSNAKAVVAKYDVDADAQRYADTVQTAVFQTAAVQVSALGVGAMALNAFSTVMLDAFGIASAATIAGFGLGVLPWRRRQVKKDLREKIELLRGQLDATLDTQFADHMRQSQQRLKDRMSPYERFVRVEQGKLERLEGGLRDLPSRIASLRQEIDRTLMSSSSSSSSSTGASGSSNGGFSGAGKVTL